jgi:acyl-CoA reductase-like NAD-dependent aldehyde dehydrogenase
MATWTELKREKNYIGGAWVDAESGKTMEVIDPATKVTAGVERALAAAPSPETPTALQRRYRLALRRNGDQRRPRSRG